jgi:transcriptional regulator with XRE-family HTH domain
MGAPSPAGGTGIDPTVLRLLKDHASTADTAFAGDLGVSRGTYNNWLNGKTQFVPEPEQYTTLRNELLKHANGLLEALALLDGVDPLEVN